MTRWKLTAAAAIAAGVALVAGVATSPGGTTGATAATTRALPPVHHVFVINLENKGYTEAFGPNSSNTDPYLSQTLTAQGVLLSEYYGIGHESNDNYIAQISGQGPNPGAIPGGGTQSDCQIFVDFVGAGTVAPGQAVGQGCVYPASVSTVANQLAARGLTWKGYMEDMGNIPSREAAQCGHPALNTPDQTQTAAPGDQYATRHDPFVYFHSIIDTPACASDVVALSKLQGDLQSIKTTPNLTYITPNLCHDGHDPASATCQPGGLRSADAWLSTWVPKILASPAYQRDGMLIVTFDESEGPQSDSSACCGEGPGPNTPLPGITGLGGGHVGAVVLSRWVRPNSSNNTGYNHYSLLASVEALFGLSRLGYAQTVSPFGLDVFTAYRPR